MHQYIILCLVINIRDTNYQQLDLLFKSFFRKIIHLQHIWKCIWTSVHFGQKRFDFKMRDWLVVWSLDLAVLIISSLQQATIAKLAWWYLSEQNFFWIVFSYIHKKHPKMVLNFFLGLWFITNPFWKVPLSMVTNYSALLWKYLGLENTLYVQWEAVSVALKWSRFTAGSRDQIQNEAPELGPNPGSATTRKHDFCVIFDWVVWIFYHSNSL